MPIVAPSHGAVSTVADATLSVNGRAALALADAGFHVNPACWPVWTNGPDAAPSCGCGGSWDEASRTYAPHTGSEIGKAPVSRLVRGGHLGASKSRPKIETWWKDAPLANVGVSLEASELVVVDCDEPAAVELATARGLDGGIVRASRLPSFVFKRPAGVTPGRFSRVFGLGLEVLAMGHFVAYGRHATGVPITIELDKLGPKRPPAPPPAWVLEVIGEQQTRRDSRAARAAVDELEDEPPVRLGPKAMRWWTGEDAVVRDGKVDRSASLVRIGGALARAGATVRTVAAALAERDQALGWNKYTDRGDGGREYRTIALDCVADAFAPDQAELVDGADGLEVIEAVTVIEADTSLVLQQQAMIRELRTERDHWRALYHSRIAVDEAPPEVLRAADKVILPRVAGLILQASARAGGGEAPLALAAGAEMTGLSANRVSQTLWRLSGSAESGAPWEIRRTRSRVVDETGHLRPQTMLSVVPHATDAPTLMHRALNFAGAAPLAKHGGTAAATTARWSPCERHADAPIRVTLACASCLAETGELEQSVLAETTVPQQSLPAALTRRVRPPRIVTRQNLQLASSDQTEDRAEEVSYVDMDFQLASSERGVVLPLPPPAIKGGGGNGSPSLRAILG